MTAKSNRTNIGVESGATPLGKPNQHEEQASAASSDEQPTMGFAYIRGQAFVRVTDIVTALKEQGYDDVAAWLVKSERGEPVSRSDFRAKVTRG